MLLCWLQVRALGGALVLRIEDVDSARVRPGAEENIYRDLDWLGFDWDEGPHVGGDFGPYRQSERSELYEDALRRLEARTFSCTCTRREIRDAAGLASTHRGEVAYPGTCRSGLEVGSQPASVRVRVSPGSVSWRDLWLGAKSEEPSSVCGDFIVRSKQGDFVYQLAVVVDDLAMEISHVLRGQDLVDSTGRQILLCSWLGGRTPLYAHTPLRKDSEGERLAKSRGSPGLTDLRESGQDPEELIGALAWELGLAPGPGLRRSPPELLDAFRQHCQGLLEVP